MVSIISLKQVKKVLNKKFSSPSEWCIDNKLSINFGDDKTKTILSQKITSPKLNISYGDYSLLSKLNTAEYVGYYFDSDLNGESTARKVLTKINAKLNSYGGKGII